MHGSPFRVTSFYCHGRFFAYSILLLTRVRKIVLGGRPTKQKPTIVSDASKILAGGPKWRIVSAEIR